MIHGVPLPLVGWFRLNAVVWAVLVFSGGGSVATAAADRLVNPVAAHPAQTSSGIADWPRWSGDRVKTDFVGAQATRTPAGWQRLWALVGRKPPAPLPPDHLGVGIFLGTRTTSGYGIDLMAFDSDARGSVLGWREQPPTGFIVPQVITHPYLITIIP